MLSDTSVRTSPRGPRPGFVRPQTVEHMKRWPREKVIQAVKDWKAEKGAWPKTSEIGRVKVGDPRWPSAPDIKRAGFTSFGDLLKAAGCSAGVALPPKAAVPAKYACACGCGHSVNPMLETFESLRRDQLSHSQIAANLGVSRSYVTLLLRKPPRFIKGHNAYAMWSGYNPKVLVPAWHNSTLGRREYEARAIQRQERSRSQRVRALLATLKPSETARLQAEREIALAMENAELAELIAEQEREARFGHRMPRWSLSLDAAFLDAAFLDFRADPNADPHRALVAAELHDALGGRDLDEVDRLDDHTLTYLQHKLADAGLVDISVTREERQLWLPQEQHRAQLDHRHEAEALGGHSREDFDRMLLYEFDDGILNRS